MNKIFLPLLAVLLITVGCSCPVKSNVPGYVASAGNHTFEVTADTAVDIELKSQLSTGFSWKLVSQLPQGIVLETESVRTSGDNKAGAEDVQVFRLIARKGEYTLIFKYGEHWKKKPEYKETSTIKLIAK